MCSKDFTSRGKLVEGETASIFRHSAGKNGAHAQVRAMLASIILAASVPA